eukprot:723985-Pyramimonas_sp.AAC.1
MDQGQIFSVTSDHTHTYHQGPLPGSYSDINGTALARYKTNPRQPFCSQGSSYGQQMLGPDAATSTTRT